MLVVKNPFANAGNIRDAGSFPGPEGPLEEGMTTHSNILAWRIPWTEKHGRLQFMGSTKNWIRLKQHKHTHTINRMCFSKGIF